MRHTLWAVEALDSVPANALIGLRTQVINDSVAIVDLPDDPRLRNPYGAVQAGPLLGLLDAAALGAILGQLDREDQLTGLVAVAKAAQLEFLAPARGALTGRSAITPEQTATLRGLLTGGQTRVGLSTSAEARDRSGELVTRATFDWVIRTRASV